MVRATLSKTYIMDHNISLNKEKYLFSLKTVILAVLLQFSLKSDAKTAHANLFGIKEGYSNTPSVIPQPAFRISLGWLSMTFNAGDPLQRLEYFNSIRDAVCFHLADDVVGNAVPVNGYKNAIQFGIGATLNYSYNRADFQLLLRQECIERIQLPYLLAFIKDMLYAGGKVTRIDLTIDDFTKSFSLEEMYEYAANGYLVARTGDVKPFFFKNVKTGEFSEKKVTFFKRSSSFFLRAYDKGLESKGKLDSHRIEAELKKKLAHQFTKTLVNFATVPNESCDSPDYVDAVFFNEFILGTIASKVDFRDKNSNARINRRTRLPFWDEFLQGAQKIALYIEQPLKSLEDKVLWLQSQVATTLSIVCEAFQGNSLLFLGYLLCLGKRKRRARHTYLLNLALKQ